MLLLMKCIDLPLREPIKINCVELRDFIQSVGSVHGRWRTSVTLRHGVRICKSCCGGSEGSPQFRAQKRNTAPIASLPNSSADSGHFFSRLWTLVTFLFPSLETIGTTLPGTTLQLLLNCFPITTKCLRDQHSGRASRLSL